MKQQLSDGIGRCSRAGITQRCETSPSLPARETRATGRARTALFAVATILVVLAIAPSGAHGVCTDPDPVYLDDDMQGSLCVSSLWPTNGSGPASFVLTARSSVDPSAPTDPDASGSPGTVKTGGKGAGVKSSSCSGSQGISGKGGHADEELIFTYDAALPAECITLGLRDINLDDDELGVLALPRAVTGPDLTTFQGTVTTLDASASEGSPSVPLSYTWTQTAGPAVSLSDANAVQPTFITPAVTQATALQFEVVVSDGSSTATDTVVVTVNVPVVDNVPPQAFAGVDQIALEFEPVLLDASDTLDVDGDQLVFQWEQVSGPPVILIGADTAQPRFLLPELEARAELEFRVSSSDGQAGSTSTTTVTASKKADEPIIFISSDGSSGYDYTILTAEIAAAFTSTGSSRGTVSFAAFTSLPPGLNIDAFKVRETRDHIYVEFVDCDCPCTTNAECSDGDACNGDEICDPDEGCLSGTPLVCDDGNICNGNETCSPASGCQAGTPLPPGTSCDDEDVCNGTDTCDTGGQCQSGAPLVCDDGNECNGVEFCDPAAGCQPGIPLNCPPVDVVFVMDTSGSMQNEGDALCSTITDVIADLATQGVQASETILAIHPNSSSSLFSCQSSSDTVSALLGDAVPGDPDGCTGDLSGSGSSEKDENWGPATAIVADRFGWTPGAIRVIVPISDEGACLGNSCYNPGSDRDAVDNAIAIAVANDVIVSPITGDGANSCVITLAQILATGTGGTAFNSSNPASDLADAIAALILAACEQSSQCDDDDLCTTGDACVDEQCVGTPVDCSHLNDQCNIGACDSLTGLCIAVPTPGVLCSDGSECTINDTCDINGVCVGAPLVCDDGNVCNGLESCDSALGCQSGAPLVCDDNDVCNGLETCDSQTGCVAGSPLPCDPQDACNTALCDPQAGCIQTPILDCCLTASECDDSNACTSDSCINNVCANEPIPCNAEDACSTAACDTVAGCQQTQIPGCCLTAAECDDTNVCTADDCISNTCVNDPLPCDPQDACNTAACDSIAGCQQTAIPDCCLAAAECSDNNACTADDCVNNVCVNDPIPCDAQDACNTAACDAQAGCQQTPIPNCCLTASECDDGSVCTSDSCINNTCVNNTLPCDPQDACNTAACDSIAGCQQTVIPNCCLAAAECNDNNACTADDCVNNVCVNDPIPCDAQDACNTAACDAQAGCQQTPIPDCCLTATECDDGSVCTSDSCINNTCVNNTLPCDPQDACYTAACDSIAGCQQTVIPCNPQDACNTAACDTGTGQCVQTPIPCDPIDACNAAACDSLTGNCVQTPIPCDPINACNTASCDSIAGCQQTPIPDCCLVAAECEDNNVCTTDDCVSNACVNDPIPCDPQDACYTAACDSVNGCQQTPIPCNPQDACHTAACDPVAGCQQTPIPNCCLVAAECDDGTVCTTDDCVNNACVNDLITCDPQDACNTAACDSVNGCQQTPIPACCLVAAECDDGTVCTTDDCVNNVCVNDLIPCDPQDACNTVACDSVNGCQQTPIPDCCLTAAECDDGTVCTSDACVNNACVNDLVPCDPQDACSTAACDSVNGCQQTSIPDCCLSASECDDSTVCTSDACVNNACVNDLLPCEPQDACHTAACDAVAGCQQTPIPDCCLVAAECDDGTVCTTDDCVNNACVNDLIPCDPQDACSTAACDSVNGCQQTPIPDCCLMATECDDSSVCTADSCINNACVNDTIPCDPIDACNTAACDQISGCQQTPIPCDPIDACHTAACDPFAGCEQTPIVCDDDNVCNGLETCDLTTGCQPGVDLVCDDGIACTLDDCDAQAGCTVTPDDSLCDDGEFCTNDACIEGQGCVFTPEDANICEVDGDLCTVDECVSGECVTDNVVCPPDEECRVYSCVPATGLCDWQAIREGMSCADDDNECTDDICIMGSCEHASLDDGVPCLDDGNECTGDECLEGSCNHPDLEDGTGCIDEGFTCTMDVCIGGGCENLPLDDDCDDNEQCTDDACDPMNGEAGTGCLFTPDDTNVCTDEDPCNVGEACVSGLCTGGSAVTCSDNGNPCTDLACDPVGEEGNCSALINVNNGGPCNDSNVCNVGETCDAGNCTGGSPVSCPDNNDTCTDSVCDPGGTEGNCTNTVIVNVGVDCELDGDPCTDDFCNASGQCAYNEYICGACCLADDTCVDDVNQAECDTLNGRRFRTGALCQGDSDDDGADDYCVPVEAPAVSDWGMIVLTMLLLIGVVLKIKVARHGMGEV